MEVSLDSKQPFHFLSLSASAPRELRYQPWHIVDQKPSSRGVFEVVAGDCHYILKKTRNGNDPDQEFQTAQELHHRSISVDGIAVTWENPIAIVQLPKGEPGVLFEIIVGEKQNDVKALVHRVYETLKKRGDTHPITSASFLDPETSKKVHALFIANASESLLRSTVQGFELGDNNLMYNVLYEFSTDTTQPVVRLSGYDVESYTLWDSNLDLQLSIKQRQELMRPSKSTYEYCFGEPISPSGIELYANHASYLLEQLSIPQ